MKQRRQPQAPLVTFRVTYPWGTTYTNRLRPALRRFGVRTMTDPFVEGSDCGGFFVGRDSESLSKARRLIRDYEKALDDDPDYDDERGWNMLLEAMERVRVFEVMQDWKHFDANNDQMTLRRLGIELHAKSRPRDREGYEVFECTLRPLRPGRARHASLSPKPKKQSR